MPLSSVSFTAEAGRLTYPLDRGLGFLSVSHLVTAVNGVPVTATVTLEPRQVTLAVAAAAGATITVQRVTPRTRLVNFLALPSGAAGLTADLLNEDARQELFLLGEGRDAVGALPDAPGMALNASGNWEGEGKRIEDLAVGVDALDILRKSQLDTAAAGVRNLPTVSGGDNDDGLFVTAGEWAKRTPTQARAHLGLGTEATLTAGVAANNAAQFDGSTPPRYPTADGRNIDLSNHSIQTTLGLRARATVVRWATIDAVSPGIDPSVATWTQNSGSRVATNSGWATRTELNNSGDIDGSSSSPRRITLAAGTWLIRWTFKNTMPTVANTTNKTSIRITSDDDTSAQVIYYDFGIHRPNTDFSGRDYSFFADTLILGFSVSTSIVFRWSNFASGGSNKADFAFLFQKLSTSVLV